MDAIVTVGIVTVRINRVDELWPSVLKWFRKQKPFL